MHVSVKLLDMTFEGRSLISCDLQASCPHSWPGLQKSLYLRLGFCTNVCLYLRLGYLRTSVLTHNWAYTQPSALPYDWVYLRTSVFTTGLLTNVLSAQLTGREHLTLFSHIKDLPIGGPMDEESEALLKRVSMSNYRAPPYCHLKEKKAQIV